jgi:hypothetical protein
MSKTYGAAEMESGQFQKCWHLCKQEMTLAQFYWPQNTTLLYAHNEMAIFSFW